MEGGGVKGTLTSLPFFLPLPLACRDKKVAFESERRTRSSSKMSKVYVCYDVIMCKKVQSGYAL